MWDKIKAYFSGLGIIGWMFMIFIPILMIGILVGFIAGEVSLGWFLFGELFTAAVGGIFLWMSK